MVRGISFEIPQKATDSLWKILSAIDVSKYFWYVIENQTEAWNSSYENDFFGQRCYDGQDFIKCIQQDQHIVFLKIEAYLSPQTFQNIPSYRAFMKSDCQFVLLIYDCKYVELYIKDYAILNSVFNRVKSLGYYNANFITDLNDNRTEMNVL